MLGNVYPHDAHLPFPQLNALFLRLRCRSGAIVVIHDRPHTPECLRACLPELAARYGLRTISALDAVAAGAAAVSRADARLL